MRLKDFLRGMIADYKCEHGGSPPTHIDLGRVLYQRIYEALEQPYNTFDGIVVMRGYLLADHAIVMRQNSERCFWASGEQFLWDED